jgi:hypothetical protein
VCDFFNVTTKKNQKSKSNHIYLFSFFDILDFIVVVDIVIDGVVTCTKSKVQIIFQVQNSKKEPLVKK